MSLSTKRIVSLYLFLLLLLSFVGVSSHKFYRQHDRLLETKENLILALSEKRAEALQRIGPDKVIEWAEEHGMVPAASPVGAQIVSVGNKPPLLQYDIAPIKVVTRW
ncbi:MAG: hypothetical protein KC422_19645 [Trueperaceae bacterium]|nr:hypothetical protein [Trueperaceae bacterium]